MVRARLTPSRQLALVFVFAHLATAATLLPLDIESGLRLLLNAAILASLAHSVWRHALLRGSHSSVEIEIANRGAGAVRDRNGEWHEVDILGTSYVTPWLTVLNVRLRLSGRPRHILLVPDSIGADDFRHVRVLLKWARPNSEAAI